MIAFARLVQLIFLPLALIGLCLTVVWRRLRPGPWRATVQTLTALCVLALQPAVLLLGSYSAGLRPQQQLLFSIWGFVVAVLLMQSWRASSPQGRRNRVAVAAGGIFMAGVGVFFGWALVGDYFLPHQRATGRVEGTRVVRHSRSPDTYSVLIDGHPYGITRDLLSRIAPGEQIDAVVGVATSTIVAIHRVVPAEGAVTRR